LAWGFDNLVRCFTIASTLINLVSYAKISTLFREETQDFVSREGGDMQQRRLPTDSSAIAPNELRECLCRCCSNLASAEALAKAALLREDFS
jgi:hypothetical protein